MFWGLILKANKKYSQTVKQAFHLSAAALDTSQVKGNDDIQVLLTSDNNVFLLCTLNKDRTLQCPLDLNFAEGDQICFSIKGEGSVHLTGFLIPDVDEFEDMDDEEASEAEDIPAVSSKKSDIRKAKAAALQAPQIDEEDSDDDEEDESFNLENAAADSDDDLEAEEGDSDDSDSAEDGNEEMGDSDEDDSDEDEDEEEQQPTKKAKLEQKPKQNGVENGQASGKEKKKEKQQQGGAKSLPGGIQVTDLKSGNGQEAKPGKKVQVYYEGRLKSNNKVFDSSKAGSGFKFTLGRGEVIKGWDIGVAGMKVGGKRRIICPPNVAYGPKGSPPVIPPNATLVFDVELKNVH